jgi:hypothetical protein
MKWMLWNDGMDMAEFGMTSVRNWSLSRESVRGCAEAYRNGERISTAHVESTVNNSSIDQLANVQQSRAGAQYLLHVKTAIINGRLDRYTGHHSVPEDIAA